MTHAIPTEADSTGCPHRPKCIMGVWQCSLCYRVLRETGTGTLAVEEPRLPPGPSECALMDESEWDAIGQIEQVRAMIPALEENRSTMGVARKLRSILGDG